MVITPLLACPAQLFTAVLAGAVLQVEGRIIEQGIIGEIIFTYVGGAHIIEVISEGEAVGNFKTEVEARADPVFEAGTNGHAGGNVAILPVTIGIHILAFGAKRAEVVFLVVVSGVRAVVKRADANSKIWCKAVRRVARLEAHEVKLCLQCQLYNIIAEAEVTLLLVRVGGVFIIIAKLGISKGATQRYIGVKVLAHEDTTGRAYIMETIIIIEIAEILGAAKGNTIFATAKKRLGAGI